MGRVAVEMSMSLDGFVAGANTDATNPLGENGELLHRWLFADPKDPPTPRWRPRCPGRRSAPWWWDAAPSTSASTSGRTCRIPVPTFVLTHRPHEQMVMPSGTFSFVTSGVRRCDRRRPGGRR